MSERPEKVSPLAAIIEPGTFGNRAKGAGVELSERMPSALVQVQAWPETEDAARKAIEKTCGRSPAEARFGVQRGDTIAIMPTGPGRWLIEAEDEELEGKLREAVGSDGAVTGLCNARLVITVEGPKANFVLASGFALDFHKDAFPSGEARQTRHHEITVTIARVEKQTFDLYIASSFARSFWTWLTTASSEVSYEVS